MSEPLPCSCPIVSLKNGLIYHDHSAACRARDPKRRRKRKAAERLKRWESSPQYKAMMERATARAAYRRWLRMGEDDGPNLQPSPHLTAIAHASRARKYGLTEHFTAAEWAALIAAQEGCCARCAGRHVLTPDHVQPISRGGANVIANIQGLCDSCNSAKGARHATRYANAS